MTDRVRNLITVLVVFLMAAAAFTAGFLANDFFDSRGVALFAGDGAFGLLDEAWGHVESSYIDEQPLTTGVVYGAIRGALGALDDRYTFFVEPVEAKREQERLRGTFGGIGAYLSRNEADELVLEPIPGNPAEAAGIEIGDVLLAVEGQPISPAMTVREISDMIRGEEGTPVELTIRRAADGATVDVTIVRASILEPSVFYRILADTPDIGYIRLARFSDESGREIADAVTDLIDQGAERFVLDMRGNPGGVLDGAVDVSNVFLDSATVLIQESRERGTETLRTKGDTALPDAPLVVLVDGGSASASEIVAGALQDNERAILVGEPTFGKGSVQLIYTLSDGSSVHITSARWFTPNRQPIDEVGLTPDIEVIPTQEAIDSGRDAALQRAIEYLQTGR